MDSEPMRYIHRMRVEELRWFLAVVDDPNVTRAAAALHVSQPALSRALKRLEAQLGTRLFDRVGRGLVPNRYGRAYAANVRRALEELDAGRDALETEIAEIRLAFLHTLGMRLVPELIGAYRAGRPQARFRLIQGSAAGLADALLEGRSDLLLTSPRPPRLAWHPLFEEPLRLVVPPDHRLAARRRVRLRELADDPFIVMRPEYGLRGITDALLATAGITPNVAFEGEDPETVRGLVRAGLGVALLPGDGIALQDKGASRTIGLAWHPERHHPPAVTDFAAFVRRSSRRRPAPGGSC
jgi:LysR family transcriptional regulator, transcription activator of glutamate synthase operon